MTFRSASKIAEADDDDNRAFFRAESAPLRSSPFPISSDYGDQSDRESRVFSTSPMPQDDSRRAKQVRIDAV